MNIDSKILNNIIASKFQEYIKKKWALSQGCKDFSVYANQSLWYTIFISKLKDKNHMIISIDSKKALDKIQHPFMIKKKTLHGRKILQHNKGYVWQTHSKYYSWWWKIKSISSKIRNKKRVPTLGTSVQHSFESPKHSIRDEKEIKEIQIGKKK